ncbi:uncharacterized protein LOC117106602 [Anneissia japonica]|uniref:uncharacterized protein LOC117106602 n=1 Tax=Anneissia japonica TaxID=1529436 RepID=UPI001425A8F0|nr:uncharacterized protein LOC117106602 [Anneissia japonica]
MREMAQFLKCGIIESKWRLNRELAILGASISLFGIYFNENYNNCIKWGARFVIVSVIRNICGAFMNGIAGTIVSGVNLDRCMYSPVARDVTCDVVGRICATYVQANTCYCCYRLQDYQFDCQFVNYGLHVVNHIHGVGSCDDVVKYIWLLWTSFGFCFLNVILGVFTQNRLRLFYKTVRSQHDMTIVLPKNSNIYVSPPLQNSMFLQQATDPSQGQQELNLDTQKASPATSEANPSRVVHESTATTV